MPLLNCLTAEIPEAEVHCFFAASRVQYAPDGFAGQPTVAGSSREVRLIDLDHFRIDGAYLLGKYVRHREHQLREIAVLFLTAFGTFNR